MKNYSLFRERFPICIAILLKKCSSLLYSCSFWIIETNELREIEFGFFYVYLSTGFQLCLSIDRKINTIVTPKFKIRLEIIWSKPPKDCYIIQAISNKCLYFLRERFSRFLQSCPLAVIKKHKGFVMRYNSTKFWIMYEMKFSI